MLISLYSPPDADLLEESYHTLWVSKFTRNGSLKIITVDSIISVVSMQPYPTQLQEEADCRWFVVEKSGLDDMSLADYVYAAED